MKTDPASADGHGGRGAGNSPGRLRLNRYLAQCGLGSRRQCDDIIRAGKVFLNGEKVEKLGVSICPEVDVVSCAGRKLVGSIVKPPQYWAYNKPGGTIVTSRDPGGRKTIYEDLARRGHRVSHCRYVGRLDRKSEGLLLLTNDGDLIHALTHPRFGVKKVYLVKIDRMLEEDHRVRMVGRGVRSAGQVLHAGAIREGKTRDKRNNDEFWYEIDLYEGKNRQIRRMFESLGYRIGRLIRVRFGCVRLANLPRGGLRPLTQREIRGLRAAGYRPK